MIGRQPKQRALSPLTGSVIPAFRGELGLKVRYHVPHVFALCAATPRVVELEHGEEALFPNAAKWRFVDRPHDDTRQKGPGVRFPQKRFRPAPFVGQNIKADVVIAPRRRQHGASKNWPHWDALCELPNVFAAGAPDSSYDVQIPRAWDYARFLDASIEALRSARLCIATDAGIAHLAVLVGCPLLLVTHKGLVAPGPVVSAEGRVIQQAYWPVKWDEYYEAANHTGAHMEMVDGWERPEAVLARARELLGC